VGVTRESGRAKGLALLGVEAGTGGGLAARFQVRFMRGQKGVEYGIPWVTRPQFAYD
jgi:hypothetical protein